MTRKEKELIDALCEEYGLERPENQTDECYDEKLDSGQFTSGCYINGQWLSLTNVINVVRRCGLLDDDEY